MELRRIQNTPQSFKGFDARPLEGVVMRYTMGGKVFAETAEEISHILKKHNVNVYVQTPFEIFKRDFKQILQSSSFPQNYYNAYPQDHLTFTTNGKTLGNILNSKYNQKLADKFNRPLENMQRHIQGGNYFIFKDDTKDSVLIGKDELLYYKQSDILKDLNVEKIYPLSQPDFHIDLAIRPLKNKQILVADDELTQEKILEGINNANEYLYKNYNPHIAKIRDYLNEIYFDNKETISKFPYKSSNETVNELSELGFAPIRVPGRVMRQKMPSDITDETNYLANYMNAIVHEKPDGSLVYLTNKSMLDTLLGITPEIEWKINFSFEKMFTDSIKDYVNKDDIHFVSGGGFIPFNVDKVQAGLHCLCAEIPKL